MSVPKVTGKSYVSVDEMVADMSGDEFLRFWNEGRELPPIKFELLPNYRGEQDTGLLVA